MANNNAKNQKRYRNRIKQKLEEYEVLLSKKELMEYLERPVIAVKDLKTGLFESLGSCKHVGEVIREFDSLVKNKQTRYGMHPSDFELYQVATFNEKTGITTAIQPPTHLASGV